MGPCAAIGADGPWADASPTVPTNNTPARETIITTASSAGMMLLVISLNEPLEILFTSNPYYRFWIEVRLLERAKSEYYS
jgi:hypothetical protein